jgi:hypothetical protein
MKSQPSGSEVKPIVQKHLISATMNGKMSRRKNDMDQNDRDQQEATSEKENVP